MTSLTGTFLGALASILDGAIRDRRILTNPARGLPYPRFFAEPLDELSQGKSKSDLLFGDGFTHIRPPDPRSGVWCEQSRPIGKSTRIPALADRQHPDTKIARTHKTWVQAIPTSCDITWRNRWDLNPLCAVWFAENYARGPEISTDPLLTSTGQCVWSRHDCGQIVGTSMTQLGETLISRASSQGDAIRSREFDARRPLHAARLDHGPLAGAHFHPAGGSVCSSPARKLRSS